MNASLPALPAAKVPVTDHPDPVRAACRRIPPLWPLADFVAVNPFLGLSDRPFPEAADIIGRAAHGDILMTAEYYREQLAGGRVGERHLRSALHSARRTLPADLAGRLDFADTATLRQQLGPFAPAPRASASRWRTFADFLDERTGSEWAAIVLEEISKWCSVYHDQGQAVWRMPGRESGFYSAWKAVAAADLNPELLGLAGFRRFIGTLPDAPRRFIDEALAELRVPEGHRADFLHRQLLSISGWSSHAQYRARMAAAKAWDDNPLSQLLAVRLAYDVCLSRHFGRRLGIMEDWANLLTGLETEPEPVCPDLPARYLAQLALEFAWQEELISKLKGRPVAPVAPAAPATLHAVFCIDVRSEVFRRALESQAAEVRTSGFAGFFGMPITCQRLGQSTGTAQCPVLLTPGHQVREIPPAGQPGGEEGLRRLTKRRRALAGAWQDFKTSGISCFSFVETAGLLFGWRLLADSWVRPRPVPAAGSVALPRLITDIPLAERIRLAAGLVRNLGLAAPWARIILLCGHGTGTVNNPYRAGLDCGACGGHAGDVNARVAADLLNEPAVRTGLRDRGIDIPDSTRFISGLHNTTTEEVTLHEVAAVPVQFQEALGEIRRWLDWAARLARQERAGPAAADGADAAAWLRARDWSEVRPEWGLAGNAAFIAAPRAWTQGVDLQGRVFLHDYDASRDADHGVLRLILTAPVIVASWINLQYYASTVNNRLFGSGNKTIHNVVGTFGVWQGNGGDLQTGLPMQSLHDGREWRHEPLRLNVFLGASREAINAILRSEPAVRELAENDWIHLFALDPSPAEVWRYQGNLAWEAVTN